MVKLRFEERNVTPCPIETFIRALFDLKKNRAPVRKEGKEEGRRRNGFFLAAKAPLFLNRKLSRGGDPDGAVLSKNKAELRPIGLQSRQTFSAILLSETTLRCAFEASRACYYD